MPSQTRTWQQRIIDGAKRRQDLASLYWMVEMRLPASLGGGYAAAAWPTRCVPVLPVAPDPEESRHWAHLLLELFRTSNIGRGIEFDLALTNDDMLRETQAAWYIYGQQVITRDCVCAHCGAIEPGNVNAGEQWLSQDCIDSGRWHGQYGEVINA
jgi:hypothetical protein